MEAGIGEKAEHYLYSSAKSYRLGKKRLVGSGAFVAETKDSGAMTGCSSSYLYYIVQGRSTKPDRCTKSVIVLK